MSVNGRDPRRFTNIAQIKAANKEAGFYWFSPSTIRFFDARVHSRIYDNGQGQRLWVESICQGEGHPREYKISQFDTGDFDISRPRTPVDTWRTSDEAVRYLIENLLDPRPPVEQVEPWHGKATTNG